MDLDGDFGTFSHEIGLSNASLYCSDSIEL